MKMLFTDLQEKIKSNKLPLILIYTLLFLLLVLTTLPRIKEFQDYQFIHSIADGFIIVNHIYIIGFFIIPCSLLITMIMFKNDFRQNNVIRQNKREWLWQKQLIQIALLNIPFIIFITCSVILLNKIFTKDWINWNEGYSVYFAANRTTTEISFTQVLITYLINTYLIIMLMNLIFQGLYWLTSHYQISWLIYDSIFVWDMVMLKQMNIVFKRLLMGYKYWLAYPRILGSTLCFTVLLLGLILAGKYFFQRKEFMND